MTVTAVLNNKKSKTQLIKIPGAERPGQESRFVPHPGRGSELAACEAILPAAHADETKLCLCERVSVGEVRALVKQGITDINQIKAVTRAGMGACGSKTCETLIKTVFRQEGIPMEQVTVNTRRPVFVEVPLGILAGSQGGDRPMAECYDVIVIGAGSVGVPAALALAGRKLSTLVLDPCPSPGQKNNKKAIGGIRATHSDFGKIRICLRSIEIFAHWREQYGDGHRLAAERLQLPCLLGSDDERKLKALMEIQHSYGLDIRWIAPDGIQRAGAGDQHGWPARFHLFSRRRLGVPAAGAECLLFQEPECRRPAIASANR